MKTLAVTIVDTTKDTFKIMYKGKLVHKWLSRKDAGLKGVEIKVPLDMTIKIPVDVFYLMFSRVAGLDPGTIKSLKQQGII